MFDACSTNNLSFQVAKMIKANEIDSAGRRRMFESVGFTFLNRLLATSKCALQGSGRPSYIIGADEIPEGCSENPYHKIAVTILACFCTDEQLVYIGARAPFVTLITVFACRHCIRNSPPRYHNSMTSFKPGKHHYAVSHVLYCCSPALCCASKIMLTVLFPLVHIL